MQSVEVIADEEGLLALGPEWDRLHGETPRHVWTSHAWIVRCWRHAGPPARLDVVAIRDGGRLVLVAPFRSDRRWPGRRTLSFIDTATPFYSDILVEDSPAGRAAVARLASTLDADRSIGRIRLNWVRDDAAAGPLLSALKASRRSVSLAFAIPLGRYAGWDGYLAAMSPKRRSNVRRHERQLRRLGVAGPEPVTDPTLLEREMSWLFARKKEQFPDSKWIARPSTEAFFLAAAIDGLATGQCRLHRLHAGGATVSSVIEFRQPGAVLLSKSAYDPAWSTYSPGMMVQLLVLRSCFAEGIATVDLMIGDHGWKRLLADREIRVAGYRVYRGLLARLGAGRS